MFSRLAFIRYFFKSGLKVSFLAKVSLSSKLEGKNVLMGRSSIINCKIGLGTYVNGALITNSQLGRFCSIGPGARIGGMGRHPTDFLSTSPLFYNPNFPFSYAAQSHYDDSAALVIIEDDVWIGAGTIVLDGVRIGTGAIVAAGAVVVSDVAPYSIVAGVPAKHKKFRHEEAVIRALLSSRWWEKEALIIKLGELSQVDAIIGAEKLNEESNAVK